jgi:hypothetical protein
MLAHGDEAFAWYSNEFSQNDLKFTIRSLLRLLQALDKQHVNETRIIFKHKPQNAFFQRLMHGSSHCLVTLKAPKKFIGVKPLHKNLIFQMENCVKDNKNCHLLAFLSFITIREVFEKVQLGFLVVGHTHEDIHGNFGYISKKLE